MATTRTRPASNAEPVVEVDLTDARKVYEEAKRIFEPESIDGVWQGPDGKTMSLAGRLAKIMAGIPEVKPEGENKFFKYKFVTDKQVLGLVRPALARQRIIIVPDTVTEQTPIDRTTEKGGSSMITRLHVVFRVIDGVDGESFTGEAIGYGDDSGDKGANKAYTAALKNFLIKLFLMGGADRDLEEDEDTDLRAKAREAGVAPVKSVEVKETIVEGVARGGRSAKATEAQVAQVSRLVAQMGLPSPDAFAVFIEQTIGDPIGFSAWGEVRKYLETLSGVDIGRLIASMETTLEHRADDQAGDGYGG